MEYLFGEYRKNLNELLEFNLFSLFITYKEQMKY
jgi:hypothetical protein